MRGNQAINFFKNYAIISGSIGAIAFPIKVADTCILHLVERNIEPDINNYGKIATLIIAAVPVGAIIGVVSPLCIPTYMHYKSLKEKQ